MGELGGRGSGWREAGEESEELLEVAEASWEIWGLYGRCQGDWGEGGGSEAPWGSWGQIKRRLGKKAEVTGHKQGTERDGEDQGKETDTSRNGGRDRDWGDGRGGRIE